MDLPEHRPMPQNRSTPFSTLPHTQEVDKERTPNKLLVEEIKIILLNHKLNPGKWSSEYIASRYCIEQDIIGVYFILIIKACS